MARGIFNIVLGLTILWFVSVLMSGKDGSADRCLEQLGAPVAKEDSSKLDLSPLVPPDYREPADC